MKNEITLTQVKTIIEAKIKSGEESVMSIHKKSGVAYHAIRKIVHDPNANPKIKTLADIYQSLV